MKGNMRRNFGRRFFTMALLCGCLGGGHRAEGQPPIPMTWYPFDSQDGFATTYESLPIVASSNLLSIPVSLGLDFWTPNVLILDTTNQCPALLVYPVIDSNGIQNLNYDPGTILLYFSPNWSSVESGRHRYLALTFPACFPGATFPAIRPTACSAFTSIPAARTFI